MAKKSDFKLDNGDLPVELHKLAMWPVQPVCKQDTSLGAQCRQWQHKEWKPFHFQMYAAALGWVRPLVSIDYTLQQEFRPSPTDHARDWTCDFLYAKHGPYNSAILLPQTRYKNGYQALRFYCCIPGIIKTIVFDFSKDINVARMQQEYRILSSGDHKAIQIG